MRIWTCKIGEVPGIPSGADLPMRRAVARAYEEMTRREPDFLFSGWGGELTEAERAVVEDRLPDPQKMSGTELPTQKISDETVNVFLRAAHETGAGAYISGGEGRLEVNDDHVRAGLAAALVASGYRREADVLREAAEAYAAQWRSAARLGQAVDLPPTQASFVAWLEVRATALEQAQPLLAAGSEVESLELVESPEGQERSEEKEHG